MQSESKAKLPDSCNEEAKLVSRPWEPAAPRKCDVVVATVWACSCLQPIRAGAEERCPVILIELKLEENLFEIS